MTAPVVREVETPSGIGRLHTRRARSPIGTLLLGHGAGRGVDSPDLMVLAENLPRHGITVALFEQPWVVAGKKVAAAGPSLDAALVAAASWMRVRTPLIIGGRSAGARSAARTANQLGASGCLLLSFPLHPVGKPEESRLAELLKPTMTTVIIQGERDPFGRPEEFPGDRPDRDITVVPAADHSLRVPKSAPISQAEVDTLITEAVLEWIVAEVLGSRGVGE
ncbi:MAG: alpha/beta hydrolase family protein [Nocardioides sp.]